MTLTVQGLRFTYPGWPPTLQGASLEVPAGTSGFLLGPSGSGKSTLLRCVNLLEPVDSGRIFFEGDEITRKGVKVDRIRQRIGIVFQQFNLFPHLRAIDNLTIAARRVGKVQRREAETRAKELLERVGLADKAGAKPAALSGGERQRVAIARALVARPPLLLADEPTGNLDARTGEGVIALFKELHADGMTLLIVTHEARVSHAATRVLVLREGRLAPEDAERSMETL